MTKQEEIKQLKLEKDAVLMAHYYVPAQVQEIADYVGDSFYPVSYTHLDVYKRQIQLCTYKEV